MDFREIVLAFKSDPLADMELESTLLNVQIICGSFEARHIDTVTEVVFIHGLEIFRFCKSVILVRHPHVPRYVSVARLGNQHSSRQLSGVIEPGDYLKFPGVAVKVDLEIMGAVVVAPESGKLTPFLKRHTFDQSSDFVFVRIEGQIFILEIIDGETLAVLIGTFL